MDIKAIRAEFPIFQAKVNGKTVAFLDSGASAQKPQVVIDAEKECYETYYANIHRGVYHFSAKSTEKYETVRSTVARFLGTSDEKEIVFTKGATESLNLIAHSYGRMVLKAGDRVLVSEMEHHANIVPWQIICQEVGAELIPIPITDKGDLDYQAFENLLDERVKIVSITHISNALGTVVDVKSIIEKAHKVGATVVIDGAQSIVHQKIDVKALEADFFVFSGHKLYGPTGTGILYGKRELLEKMPPYQTGGDMIDEVTFEKTTFAPLPNKFEAGTPNIAGMIGLGVAIDWLENIGYEAIVSHETMLFDYALKELSKIPELTIIGEAKERSGVLSFIVDNIHPHDIGSFLDSEGVAIRVGHHCAQPVMVRMGVPATARMSLGIYNNQEDIDRLTAGLKKIIAFFA